MRIIMYYSVFNKGRQPAKHTGYSTYELTAYLIEKLPHILQLTWETFATKQEPWIGKDLFMKIKKDFAWILSNFSGDLCFVFCPNTLILAPECLKWILRGPKFQNFPGEHTPGPSQNLAPSPQVVHSLPTPEILPPTQIPIENPGLLVQMLYHWATGDLWELRPLN